MVLRSRRTIGERAPAHAGQQQRNRPAAVRGRSQSTPAAAVCRRAIMCAHGEAKAARTASEATWDGVAVW